MKNHQNFKNFKTADLSCLQNHQGSGLDQTKINWPYTPFYRKVSGKKNKKEEPGLDFH